MGRHGGEWFYTDAPNRGRGGKSGRNLPAPGPESATVHPRAKLALGSKIRLRGSILNDARHSRKDAAFINGNSPKKGPGRHQPNRSG